MNSKTPEEKEVSRKVNAVLRIQARMNRHTEALAVLEVQLQSAKLELEEAKQRLGCSRSSTRKGFN